MATYDTWIGRSETEHDVVAASPARRMALTIDRDDLDLRTGDELPAMWHWLSFPNQVATGDLGPDGHPPRGGLLPPIDLPRRMFAGAEATFHRPLRIGDGADRRSTVASIEEKTTRSGDPLILVTIEVEISDAEGLAITERQTIAYTVPGRGERVARADQDPDRPWTRELTPSETMLFRFSALTWNAHRIHYDQQFATMVDGHPALVVQGPLVALLLLDLWGRNGGTAPRFFRFRATSPLYVNERITLTGGPDGALAAYDRSGTIAMTAIVET